MGARGSDIIHCSQSSENSTGVNATANERFRQPPGEAATVTLAAGIVVSLGLAWGWVILQFVQIFVTPGVREIQDEVFRTALR